MSDLLIDTATAKGGLIAFAVLTDFFIQNAHREARDYVVFNGANHLAERIEFGYIYDSHGIKLIAKMGVKSAVQFDDSDVEILKKNEGSTLFHNHPSNASLSRQDLLFQNSYKLKLIRAIGSNGIEYEGAMLNGAAFQVAYPLLEKSIRAVLTKLIYDGDINNGIAEKLHYHILNTILSNLNIITYKVTDNTGHLSDMSNKKLWRSVQQLTDKTGKEIKIWLQF